MLGIFNLMNDFNDSLITKIRLYTFSLFKLMDRLMDDSTDGMNRPIARPPVGNMMLLPSLRRPSAAAAPLGKIVLTKMPIRPRAES